MNKTFSRVALLSAYVSLYSAAFAAPVTFSLSNGSPAYTSGQTLQVVLSADFPDPALGFGLDVKFDTSQLSLNSFTVGTKWFPASGTEPNDYIGLAFPTPVVGAGTLLGTFSFTALTTGSSLITLAYDSTNLAEGVPLAAGGFAATNLADESARQITPEPPSLLLLATGVLVTAGVLRRRIRCFI